MFGVEQPYLIDTFLQREKHWLPIHSGRLHTDQLHLLGRQPVPELAQPARGRRKRARRDPPLPPFQPGARTVATTVSRCTSNPAQQSINCSIASLPHRRVRTHLRVRGDAARVRSCHSQGV